MQRKMLVRGLLICAGLLALCVWLDIGSRHAIASWLYRHRESAHHLIRRLCGLEAPQSVAWYAQQLQRYGLGVQLTLLFLLAWLALALAAFPRWLCLVAVTLLGGSCVWLTGFDGFALHDQSLIFDGGWRILHGQVPYRDFSMPLGPLIFLLQALVFAACGVSLRGFVACAAVLSSLTGALAFEFLRRVSRSHALALAVAYLTIACGVFALSAPWYDYAAVLCVLAALCLWWRARETRHPRGALIAAGCCAALACLAKQNIGFAATGVMGILIWQESRRWQSVLLFALGWWLAAGAWLGWAIRYSNVKQFAYDFFIIPWRMGRLPHLMHLTGIAGALWLPTLLTIALACRMTWRAHRDPALWPIARVGLAITALQWVSLRTSAAALAPYTGVLLGLWLVTEGTLMDEWVYRPGRQPSRSRAWVIAPLLIGTLGFFTSVGATRRVLNYVLVPLGVRDYHMQTPTLRPLRMDRLHGAALDEVAQYITTRIPPQDAIMIFPNDTLLFGATGKASTLPLLMLANGFSYFPGDATDDRLCQVLTERRVRWVFVERLQQVPNHAPEEHFKYFPRFTARLAHDFTLQETLQGYAVLVQRASTTSARPAP